MPDLLLELRSEEIPARMQRKAAGDLRKLVTDGLVEAGLAYEGCQEYWTPRRLALDIRGVAARSKDVREEVKGPPVKAPEQAVQGFLRKAGLSSVDQLSVHTDPKKGDFYVAVLDRPGRAADEIVAAIMPGIIRDFPWPKSMRWGAASTKPGSLRWVRPLQSILCTFGPETEEPAVVDFEVDGIRAGNVTWGHRFHAPEAITVRRFDDYRAKLEAAKVVLDGERRKEVILHDARNLAFASGLELVEDQGLLDEVSGLVEWPVVLMGEFEDAFLDIPAEIIRLTIRANQKCFVTRPLSLRLEGRVGGEAAGVGSSRPSATSLKDQVEAVEVTPPGQTASGHPPLKEEGELAPRFILTANIEAKDGGAEIARGNAKVVRARLSDAVHFWKTDQADLPDLDKLKPSAERLGLDLRKPLDQRMARLDHLGVTFHARLGTQGERVERIAGLAEEIAGVVGADPALARRAALLAKADLQTEVVGEFPELQGAMGRKYAALQGEHPAVAAAIEEHYRPLGPSDVVPTDPVSIAVALADKLDTLVGFWAIDEKPTGSKDPYALRRAALGVIRILVENGVGLGLGRAFERHSLGWLATIDDYRLSTPAIAYENNETNADLKVLARVASSAGFAAAIVAPSTKRLAEIEALPDRGFDGDGVGEEWIQRIFALTEWRGRTEDFRNGGKDIETLLRIDELGTPLAKWAASNNSDLLSFFHDRLKVYLRDKGARHDLIDAVLASGGSLPLEGRVDRSESDGTGGVREAERGQSKDEAAAVEMTPSGPAGHPPRKGEGEAERGLDQPHPDPLRGSTLPSREREGSQNDDLLLVVRRVEALSELLETEDGQNLLAGTKRAANILAAEEKKGTRIAASVDAALLSEPEEKELFGAVDRAERLAERAIGEQDFAAAMRALAGLRGPVDAFFEKVLVNADDEAVRANRLALLARIRAATGQVADFSRIAG